MGYRDLLVHYEHQRHFQHDTASGINGISMSVCYTADGHAVYHGDSLEILQQNIPDNSVDLIFVDPPYNIDKRFREFRDKWPSEEVYVEWCYKWLSLCIDKLKSAGSMYVMASTQSIPYIDIFLRSKITIQGRIVWSYDSSGAQAKNYYGSMYEPILFCVRDPKNYTFNADDILVEAKTGAQRKLIDYRKPVPAQYSSKRVPGNVWNFPRVRYRMDEYEDHPAQKPESLLSRIILASSNEGDMVLDPFAGTFTTCAVARALNRQSIGIELVSNYVEIGLRRVLGFSSVNNKSLAKPKKEFKRKNGKGIKGLYADEAETAGLFDDDTQTQLY